MKGYFSIPNAVAEHPKMKSDRDYIRVVIYVYRMRRFAPGTGWFHGKTIPIKVGQLPIISYQAVSYATGVDVKKVERLLKQLQSDGHIDLQTSRHGTLVTVLYDFSVAKSDAPIDVPESHACRTSDAPLTAIEEVNTGNMRKNDEDENARARELRSSSSEAISHISRKPSSEPIFQDAECVKELISTERTKRELTRLIGDEPLQCIITTLGSSGVTREMLETIVYYYFAWYDVGYTRNPKVLTYLTPFNMFNEEHLNKAFGDASQWKANPSAWKFPEQMGIIEVM